MSSGYTVHFTEVIPPLDVAWESPLWQQVEEALIQHFHPASSAHRPVSRVRVLYDHRSLYVQFHVDDRHVRSTRTHYQESVCQDSCVEFFVQPDPGGGYFNFEVNCGGTLLLYFIEDPTRTANGFARFTPVAAEHGRRVRIAHSMPAVVFPEEPGPICWQVGCQIPVDLFEAYVGPLGTLSGQTWRANFYKCADGSSQPHWASWSPIGEELNFHQPSSFAPLRFAEAASSPRCGTHIEPNWK